MADKTVYKCLSPIGVQEPVEQLPLAPRLDSLDGKRIHLSICGEPDITIPLEKKLKSDFPKVEWKVKKTYGTYPVRLSEEEMRTVDGVILGVCW